jgi:exonuclease SbcC
VRVVELSLRNYRQFEELDLELPARVIGIFGANGSGKSTLVESFAFALYGHARTKRQDVRTHGVLTECVVRLVFEHGGTEYEIRRILRGRNHAASAELYAGTEPIAVGVSEVGDEIRRLLHMDQQVFRASVFAEQKQLDAFSDVATSRRKEMVLRLLGIRPVDEARSAARRASKTTRERAAELAGALVDPRELEAGLKDAKATLKGAKAAAKEAAVALKAAEARSREASAAFEVADGSRERAEKLGVELRQLAERRKETEELRAGLEERLARSDAELAELPGLEAELASLRGVDDLLAAARALDEIGARAADLTRELEALGEPDADRAAAELARAQGELDEAARSAAEATARAQRDGEAVADLQERVRQAGEADPSQPCPTCGQELGARFRDYVKHRKAEASEARSRAATSAKEARAAANAEARARRALERARKAEEQARRVADRRTSIQRQAAELEEQATRLRSRLGDVEPDVRALGAAVRRERELDQRRAALAQVAAQRAQLEEQLVAATRRLSEHVGRIAELEAEIAGLAFDPAAHDALRTARDLARTQLDEARAADRTSTDAMGEAQRVVDVLAGRLADARAAVAKVSDLRDEAHHLGRVADLLDGFRDHLVSRVGPELSREAEALFRELTNHEYEDLRLDDETLAIQIADGERYFPIERFSGSETDLANLALRVAISMHLSRVSGADIGMMVLDEVLGSLDTERKDLLVRALGRLGARFHQLFVITHSEQVKDAFPAAIEVRKVGRRRSEAVLL